MRALLLRKETRNSQRGERRVREYVKQALTLACNLRKEKEKRKKKKEKRKKKKEKRKKKKEKEGRM
jgi:hypothetical protein